MLVSELFNRQSDDVFYEPLEFSVLRDLLFIASLDISLLSSQYSVTDERPSHIGKFIRTQAFNVLYPNLSEFGAPINQITIHSKISSYRVIYWNMVGKRA